MEVHPEMERGALRWRRFRPRRPGIFKPPASTDLKKIRKQHKERVPALRFVVAISPLGDALGMIASPHRSLPFCRQIV